MTVNVAAKVASFKRMSVRQLRVQYAEIFSEETKANNKAWLIKRIVWRIQSELEGDISVRAQMRAAELANDSDLRRSPPKNRSNPAFNPSHDSADQPTNKHTTQTVDFAVRRDDRVPPPGGIITRTYKTRQLQVRVLARGFEFEGTVYRSLSAIAKHVSGQHVNGFSFFKLKSPTTNNTESNHERP